MNKSIMLLDLFDIDRHLVDSDKLMLALTHKVVLNENRNKEYFSTLDYYYEVGMNVYETMLKIFIFDNLSKQSSAIEKIYNASKNIFIDELLNKYNIIEHMIYKEENNKIRYQLAFQMLGFIYIETSYQHLENIFKSIFDVNKLVYVDDYLLVINSIAKDQIAQFNEVEVRGPDHAKEYRFELIYNGKSVIAEGSTIKKAKANCAKLFCQRYLTNYEIMKYSGIRKSQTNRRRKKYYIDDKLEATLTNLSRELNLSKQDLMVCLTHSSIAHEYDLISNSPMQVIGSNIERLFLLKKTYSRHKGKPFQEVYKRVSYLQGNENVFKQFINKYKLKDALLVTKGTIKNEAGLMKAFGDTYKAILFFDFYRNKNMVGIWKLEELYDFVLEDIDEKYISPIGDLQKVTNQLNINIDYIYSQGTEDHTYKAEFHLPGMTLTFTSSGKSKSEARALVSVKVLKWFYEEVELFLLGETDRDYDFLILEEFLLFLIKDRASEFRKLNRDNNYFGLQDAISGDSQDFIEKLSKILFMSIENFKISTHKDLITFIISIHNLDLVCIKETNYLLEAVIWDLNEFILDQNNIDSNKYSIENNDKKLNIRSRELLLRYISTNGALIKNIKRPSVELQLAAVKNNPVVIHYIDSPAREVFTYLLEIKVSQNIESLIINKAKNDTDILIELMSKKYINYLDDNKNDIIFSLLSKTVTFDIHIRALFKMTKINKFHIATGFVYSSGLELLKNEIDQLLANNGDLKMIIGSLQNYSTGQMMKNMDKKTAIYLNELINNGTLVKTNDSNFYHGKIYLLESDSLSIVIIGSSNLSKSAFHHNIELDNILFYRKSLGNEYTNWFEKFWSDTTPIPQLDISKFSAKFEYDTGEEEESDLKTITMKNVQERINTLPDEMLRRRLLLWLEYNPSNIYDDIDVADQNYIAIEYSNRNMIVLESFLHGNSYFVFYNLSIDSLIEYINNKTKTEIFELSNMEKRGYHVRELLTLELNIKSYFLHK